MKQIRVKSPFLDITESNIRREVGDILLVKEERAAYLVNGQLCEYVKDDEEKKPADTDPQPPAAPADKPATEPIDETASNGETDNGDGGKAEDETTADGNGESPAEGETHEEGKTPVAPADKPAGKVKEKTEKKAATKGSKK